MITENSESHLPSIQHQTKEMEASSFKEVYTSSLKKPIYIPAISFQLYLKPLSPSQIWGTAPACRLISPQPVRQGQWPRIKPCRRPNPLRCLSFLSFYSSKRKSLHILYCYCSRITHNAMFFLMQRMPTLPKQLNNVLAARISWKAELMSGNGTKL